MRSTLPLPPPLFPPTPQSCAWPWGASPEHPAPATARDPLISVVIPSYNQGIFLEATLRSVLLQDYASKEVIVIDGGSTDESLAVIAHYQPWLAYSITEKDNGQAHAINKGLKVATGALHTFLNSDDLQVPGALRRVARAAAAHPEVLMFYGHRILIDSAQAVIGWSWAAPFNPLANGYTIPSETAFWRASAPGAAEGFDESLRFALDLDFFVRLHQRGRFLLLNAYLGYFRCHADAKSSVLQDVCAEESRRLWQKYFQCEPVRTRPGLGHRLRILKAALLNPRLVFVPYLRRRFARA